MTDFIIIIVALLIVLSFLSMIGSMLSGAFKILSPPSAQDVAEKLDKTAKRERCQKLL